MLGITIPSGVEGNDLSKAILEGGSSDSEAADLQGMGVTAAWADGSEWRAETINRSLSPIGKRLQAQPAGVRSRAGAPRLFPVKLNRPAQKDAELLPST